MHKSDRVVVGGTFAYLHKGHMELLKRAFNTGRHVMIGLTSDQYASKHKKLGLKGFEERKNNLIKALTPYRKRYEIVMINDKYGSSIFEDLDAIVVSDETYKTAIKINSIRRSRKLKPMRIVVVKHVLAQDDLPISSSRILEGKINPEGELFKEQN